jgi:hypothetical protein
VVCDIYNILGSNSHIVKKKATTARQRKGMVGSDHTSQWPQHPQYLIPGVNDSWNDFQKFCKGQVVTGKEWKVAREALHAEYKIFIAEGGSPASISMETHRSRFNSEMLARRLHARMCAGVRENACFMDAR